MTVGDILMQKPHEYHSSQGKNKIIEELFRNNYKLVRIFGKLYMHKRY